MQQMHASSYRLPVIAAVNKDIAGLSEFKEIKVSEWVA
jgi:hypothetical protein